MTKALSDRELPPGVQVIDFGSGGLDLAYEVMRGYDALVLIDISRQGERPGTLYVMEAKEDDVEGSIEDGQMIDPTGWTPKPCCASSSTSAAGRGASSWSRASRRSSTTSALA